VNIGHLANADTDALNAEYRHWLNLVDQLGVKAFVELTLCGSVREGAEHLLRISGDLMLLGTTCMSVWLLFFFVPKIMDCAFMLAKITIFQ